MKFFNKTSLGFILRFSLIVSIAMVIAIAINLYVSQADISTTESATSSQGK